MSSKPIEQSEIVGPSTPGVSPPHPREVPGGRMGMALAILSLGLLVPLSLSGLYGGSQLARDPTGTSMQMSLTLLSGSPFANFEIPGVVLFLANGVLPLSVSAAVVVRSPRSPELVMLCGIVLTFWMGVQMALIGYSFWLQALLAGMGVLILTVGAAWSMVARS